MTLKSPPVILFFFSIFCTHLSSSHAELPTQVAEDDGPALKRMKAEDTSVQHQQQEHHTTTTAAPDNSSTHLLDASMAIAVDPNMLNDLTPEQLAALQQGMPMLTPEMLTAVMQQQPAGGGGEQHHQQQQPHMHMHLPLLDMNGQAFTGAFDAASLGMSGIGNIPGMDVLQQLPPDQLQAFLQNPSLTQFLMPGGFALGGGNESNSTYKNWWDEKDEHELLRMVQEPEYRREKLGSSELDWISMETYFNRSQNALRKKFWVLSKNAGGNPAAYGVQSPSAMEGMNVDGNSLASAAAAAALQGSSSQPVAGAADSNPSSGPRHRAERKNWNEAETLEMARIVSDPSYRLELGLQQGEEEVSYEALGNKFGCTVQTAKRKYRHLQDQALQNNGVVPEKKKREHYRKSVPYRWMIVSALSKIAGFEATAPQIFDSIEQDPELRGQLDTRIMPGTKHVPRWKIQIRKVLSADHIFINTGVKQKHETIWRLDPVALQEANADRQRQRAGVPPITLATSGGLDGGAAMLGGGGGTGGGTEDMAMHMQLNEQTMAMLQQQQQMMLGQPPLQLGTQQLQMMGLPDGVQLDPTTLAALMAGGVPLMDQQQLEQLQQQQQQEEQQMQGGGGGGAAAVTQDEYNQQMMMQQQQQHQHQEQQYQQVEELHHHQQQQQEHHHQQQQQQHGEELHHQQQQVEEYQRLQQQQEQQQQQQEYHHQQQQQQEQHQQHDEQQDYQHQQHGEQDDVGHDGGAAAAGMAALAMAFAQNTADEDEVTE